jgi:hypothetical protein
MQMRFLLLLSLPLTHALITLSTIRNLTSLTDECLARITPTTFHHQDPLLRSTDQERDDVEAVHPPYSRYLYPHSFTQANPLPSRP